MFGFLKRQNDTQAPQKNGRQNVKFVVRDLYDTALLQARRPEFYRDMGVPDTIDGRFEMLCLHCFLVIQRLQMAGRDGKKLAQRLFDLSFKEMEHALREIGIGDLAVPHHMRRMMRGFNGRAHSYRQALESIHAGQEDGDDPLEEVIVRNIFGTLEDVDAKNTAAVKAYILQKVGVLAAQDNETILNGEIYFDGI